ncbi:hypothetical protein [Glycomyces sp. YM15]|uniref:hypothetical protein n=1 Tax=Glycomyces sp. YM15 TaxID=2800446 RepID=UPI001964C4AA|nr:hypothetical protein [Glycomyces sp. YM15]
MKRILFKTFAATGAAALLLSGCSLFQGGTDTGGNSNGDDGGSDNAVYTEMASWDACEVLGNLQPITDEMGIQGYGSSTSAGGDPSTAKIGNTWDPESIGCNDLIYLGPNEGVGGSGEIKVKIVPTENEEQATAAYDDRVSGAEAESAQWEQAKSEEFGDPWDAGTIVSWTGDTSQPFVQVIARDGQWVFHIDLYYTQDYGLRGGGEPALAFTTDELNQWFVDTYLPEVNQIVNDRIAEVQ